MLYKNAQNSKISAIRAIPLAALVILASKKVYLFTLIIAFLLYTLTDSLFYSLLVLKYYFFFNFFYIILLRTLN